LLGWDDKGRIYMMVSTSGRADTWGGYRIGGATIAEMATWLKARGATHAVNLDGGGSTILLINKQGSFVRVDLPKNSYRRPVPNAVAFVPR
jgi:exopolysaccharide biosynthesis protein